MLTAHWTGSPARCSSLAAMLAFLLCFLVVADVIGPRPLQQPGEGHARDRLVLDRHHLLPAGGLRDPQRRHDQGGRHHAPTCRCGQQSLLAAFGALLGIAFFALVCWGSIDGAAHAWTSNEFEGEGALRVPVWPARFAIVGGTALAAFSYVVLHAAQPAMPSAAGAPPAAPSTSH